MSLSFFIARRYLFSKKSHNAINIISAIAVGGIALAAAAMITVLSVFNGFRDLVSTLYTHFDPPLLVVPTQGKFMENDDPALEKMRHHAGIEAASSTFEENALILFRGHPLVIKIKGVDEKFPMVTDIKSILKSEDKKLPPYRLAAAEVNYGIIGEGLAQQIGTINYGELQICAPRSGERINIANPIESFSVDNLHSNGLAFAVKQSKYDNNYILTSLGFATGLFEKEGQISRLELKVKDNAQIDKVKAELRAIGGERFQVLDRIEQQEEVFNIMQVEKLVGYIFLTFITLVACFNIISSLSMLIIEKRDDVETLRHLGLSNSRIRGIFMTEGRLIALFGATIGLILGIGICLLQQEYGLIRFGNSDAFIISAYPVSVHWLDVAVVFFTVLGVGFLSVAYAVHALSKRLLKS